ncbi:hypothetical protein RND81_02G140700 [Saponaria officinalis]|uniref:Era-type G domain-containing protein n=1 Tax=Saponaria officinalis TaxID=3572 RepID=A0AAW1MV35_SAPOF
MAAISAKVPPLKLKRQEFLHHNSSFNSISPFSFHKFTRFCSFSSSSLKLNLSSSKLGNPSTISLKEKIEDEIEYEGEDEDEDEDEEGSEFVYYSSSSSYAEADEEDESLSSSSSSGYLSLSEKPDRNIALLDEYEMEENGYDPNSSHRSGYVAVVGKPNVGKSTLSNQIVGQKLSIVTDKPQTTRHRILGISSGPEYQMILYDTPGVIEKKMHKLDTMMMKNVRSAAINADCVVVVVDACKMPQNLDEVFNEGVGELKDKLPTLLVLNKKDLIKPGEIAKKLQWYEKFTDVDEVIPVSAKYGHGVEDVKEWILSKLPLGPPYYPKVLADNFRFFEIYFMAHILWTLLVNTLKDFLWVRLSERRYFFNTRMKFHMHAKLM